MSILQEFQSPVAVVVLLESLPVADGTQSPLLLKRPAGDRRLSAVQCPVFLICQSVQSVIRINFAVAGKDFATCRDPRPDDAAERATRRRGFSVRPRAVRLAAN